jgi:hypothetical protein
MSLQPIIGDDGTSPPDPALESEMARSEVYSYFLFWVQHVSTLTLLESNEEIRDFCYF